MVCRRKSNQFQAFSTSISLSLSFVLQCLSLLVHVTISPSFKDFDEKRKISFSSCESPIALFVSLHHSSFPRGSFKDFDRWPEFWGADFSSQGCAMEIIELRLHVSHCGPSLIRFYNEDVHMLYNPRFRSAVSEFWCYLHGIFSDLSVGWKNPFKDIKDEYQIMLNVL